MNAQTLWWLVFLNQIKNVLCYASNPFILREPPELTATAGSCKEIKLQVKQSVRTIGAHWFWLKDPNWINTESGYSGTIIYSSNQTKHPLSSDFKNRVTSNCTHNIREMTFPEQQCNILICDLKKADSGNYSFRFVRENKWMTKPWTALKVQDNPCPITFEQPPVMRENSIITLRCSTLHSCPSKPKIEPPTQLISVSRPDETSAVTSRVTTVSFTAWWTNDGKEFTCQTSDNEDKYLIRRTRIVVEYAPKKTSATISSSRIKEGDTVTLTCSSKGRPELSFTWFHNEVEQLSGANWTIRSIRSSQSGSYYCAAKNRLDTERSNTVRVDVLYVPDVEVQISKEPKRNLMNIKQGDEVTFTCNVKRSNPTSVRFSWAKDGNRVGQDQKFVRNIQPEDSGNYTCTATNDAGSGTSKPHRVLVQYRPRNTRISPSEAQNTRVKVNSILTLTCITEAEPAARFSWYKQTDTSQWTPMTEEKILRLEKVQRTDEACYRCRATNNIGMGDPSKPVCIQVLFPPTNVLLSMDNEVTEGQLVTITCTAESFPSSRFTITRDSSSNHRPSDGEFSQYNNNTFHSTFIASSTDEGVYFCNVANSEGTVQSNQRKLVVKYTPKDVKVESQPGLTVKENTTFKLDCGARSYAAVTSVIWMKKINGSNKVIQSHQKTFFVKSASPSDSGLYSCTARNEIGAGNSSEVHIQVKYAPKHVRILKGEEQQTDGIRSVTLSCITQCYPEVSQYLWYKKTYDKKGGEKVSESQNFTVNSDQKGEYYCVAGNEINQKTSEPIRLFDDRLIMVVKISCLICLLLLICLLIFFLYRRRRNKSNQQGPTQPSCGSLGWWNRGRSRMNETALTEPFRSRDDLLPDQPCRPNGQRWQPHPDSTSASNIDTVYATVNLDSAKLASSAPKPEKKHGAHMADDSLNYASLHFGNHQKKLEEDSEVVYAKVSKAKASHEMERVADYENISSVCAAKLPDQYDSDSDTSEDEVEVNYSQVNFRPKCGQQRRSGNTSSDSTSSEDETQYSQVKI